MKKVIIFFVIFFSISFVFLPGIIGIKTFQMNGQSMYDTFYNREFFLINKHHFSKYIPERGDIVVVRIDDTFFLKRVIGLSGEQLKIEEGKVYIQGVLDEDFIQLDEPYLASHNNEKTYIRGDRESHTYDIPEENYYLMGDNRLASTDSRSCFGSCSVGSQYIEKSQFVGKVFFDLGYFQFKSFSFSHPDITKDGEFISAFPRFFDIP